VVGAQLRWFSSRKAHGSKVNHPAAYEVVTQLIKEGERAQDGLDSAVAVARYSEALGRYAEEFRAGRGWMNARQVAEVAVRLGHSLRDQGDTGGAENAFRQAVLPICCESKRPSRRRRRATGRPRRPAMQICSRGMPAVPMTAAGGSVPANLRKFLSN